MNSNWLIPLIGKNIGQNWNFNDWECWFMLWLFSVVASWFSFCSVKCNPTHPALWAWRESCKYTQMHTQWSGQTSWLAQLTNWTIQLNWMETSAESVAHTNVHTQWRPSKVHDPAAASDSKTLAQLGFWENKASMRTFSTCFSDRNTPAVQWRFGVLSPSNINHNDKKKHTGR